MSKVAFVNTSRSDVQSQDIVTERLCLFTSSEHSELGSGISNFRIERKETTNIVVLDAKNILMEDFGSTW